MHEFGAELDERIWKTKGARFNAYRRLTKRHQLSYLATAFMSVYVVFFALASVVLPRGAGHLDGPQLSLATAFMAIAILVINATEYFKSYQLRGDRLHRSAMDLSELYDELRMLVVASGPDEVIPQEKLQSVDRRYHEILKSVPDNHDPGDYELLKAQYPEDFKLTRFQVGSIRVREFLRIGGWYYGALVLPPLLFILLQS